MARDDRPVGTFIFSADELMSDPPANLTQRGMTMLREIWEAAGRPANEDDAPFVDLDVLASHAGTEAKRRSASRVRAHLTAGGHPQLPCLQAAGRPRDES